MKKKIGYYTIINEEGKSQTGLFLCEGTLESGIAPKRVKKFLTNDLEISLYDVLDVDNMQDVMDLCTENNVGFAAGTDINDIADVMPGKMDDIYNIAEKGLDLPENLEKEILQCFDDECSGDCDSCEYDCDNDEDLDKKFNTAVTKGILGNVAVYNKKEDKLRQFSIVYYSDEHMKVLTKIVLAKAGFITEKEAKAKSISEICKMLKSKGIVVDVATPDSEIFNIKLEPKLEFMLYGLKRPDIFEEFINAANEYVSEEEEEVE